MIPLTEQVCSLDFSKKLKEIGIPQSSLFCWMQPYDNTDYELFFDYKSKSDTWYSAFTVAELDYVLYDYYGRITSLSVAKNILLSKATSNPADYRASLILRLAKSNKKTL